MTRAWLPLAIAAVLMLVIRHLSGIKVGAIGSEIIVWVLVGLCLVIAVLLIPRKTPPTCDDSSET